MSETILPKSVYRRKRLVSGWHKRIRKDGSLWYERSVDGFESMVLEKAPEGKWRGEFGHLEQEFELRKDAEEWCLTTAILDVEEFRDYCEDVRDALIDCQRG